MGNTIDKNENCCICLLDGVNYKTNCNHLFHKNCLIQWFKINKTCPICRSRNLDWSILEEQIHIDIPQHIPEDVLPNSIVEFKNDEILSAMLFVLVPAYIIIKNIIINVYIK
jgi:hypothetical protein